MQLEWLVLGYSTRIGTVRGIPIRIHITFLLALPLLAFGFARAFRAAASLAEVPPDQLSGSPWLWGFGVAIALFASVLAHELAHSLYALRKGGRIREITLLMIGGVSQMSEAPREPRHEAVMALVGPLVSLALGGVLYLLQWIAAGTSFNVQFALFYLGTLNIFLGLFNLLPAFPMDGGRILRALLARPLGVVRATNVAARIGKLFAVLFGIWGFFTLNMLLLLIAFFVYVGAQSEAHAITIKALLGRLQVRDVMSTQVTPLPADLSVRDAADRMIGERRSSFATTMNGDAVGLVTLDAVRAVPQELRATTPVRSIAVEMPPLSPSDEATSALRLLSETDMPELAVVEEGHLVGTIGRDDIARTLQLRDLETGGASATGWRQRTHATRRFEI